jgi:hypothetical protein
LGNYSLTERKENENGNGILSEVLEKYGERWISYMDNHRVDLRFSTRSSRFARRSQANDLPALRPYLAMNDRENGVSP